MGGISGIYLHEKECFDALVQSTFHLQHRGAESSAIDTSDAGSKEKIRPGEVKKAFSEEDRKRFEGNYGIGSLSGGKAEFAELSSPLGEFSIVYNGEINSRELREELKDSGESFSTHSDAEVLGRLISKGGDLVDGIKGMNQRVKGSYSIGIMNGDGLYLTRDPYGILPLSVGKGGGGYAFASESPALTELGFEDFRDVEPGEILKIGEDGINSMDEMESERHAHCAFEWGYTSRPDSVIEGIEVMEVRRKAGKSLAEEDDIEADVVGSIPMSGRGYTEGYQEESGLPQQSYFYLNRWSGRSYTPSDPDIREQKAKEKLSPIPRSIQNRRLVVVDDSIVRGNQMLRIRNTLKGKDAKEVHARIGCPPLQAPCPYTSTTKEYSDLIYNRCDGNIEEIASRLNVDSLKYNKVEDFVDAIGLPKEELCLGCFTDEYPTCEKCC